MANFETYKSLQILSTEPVGDAGIVLNSNFTFIADTLETLTAVLRVTTTDATPTELLGNSTRYLIAENTFHAVKLSVLGLSSTGIAAMFLRELVIKNVEGSVSLQGSVQSIGTDINPSSWSIVVSADDTNKSLKIAAIGQAGTTIRWTCRVDAVMDSLT